jgi:hypothetical protein
MPWLRGYIDNQLALIKELQTVQSARGLPTFLGFGTFAPGDEQLAVNAGVSTPGLYAFVAPHVVMNDVAALLVFGAPPFGSQIETDDLDLGEARRICYYKLDRGWSGLATRLLDEALREIAAHEVIYKEREAVRTLRKYAGALLALGQPAQAVAKLQTALSSYPRSEQFNEVRRDLEEILNGELPKPACRDPR